MADFKNYITPARLQTLARQHLYLRVVERPKVVDEVAYAASLGDRSENGLLRRRWHPTHRHRRGPHPHPALEVRVLHPHRHARPRRQTLPRPGPDLHLRNSRDTGLSPVEKIDAAPSPCITALKGETAPKSDIETALEKGEKAIVYSILFDFDSDRIRPESKPILDELAQILARHPDWKLDIAAHTDSVGSDTYNLTLSERRAKSTLTALIERGGFGNQPYLVYKHEDAGHPHIHIVSTTIKHDGSRINTHNIGRNQSEKVRKEIEKNYGLIKAERQQQLVKPGIKAVDIEKAIYGKSETKRNISNVVGPVFSQYKFTFLPEF